jgi:hypothetical protein
MQQRQKWRRESSCSCGSIGAPTHVAGLNRPAEIDQSSNTIIRAIDSSLVCMLNLRWLGRDRHLADGILAARRLKEIHPDGLYLGAWHDLFDLAELKQQCKPLE